MTREEAVGFLQESGWLQDHDRQIYEQGKVDGIKWHPFPKDKPKVANWYLVTLDYEDMDNFVSKIFWDGKTDLIWDCCIAWAELPKPYEEGADNE